MKIFDTEFFFSNSISDLKIGLKISGDIL